jgi:hypothetical protein
MDPLLTRFTAAVSSLVPPEHGGSLSQAGVEMKLDTYSSEEVTTLLTKTLGQKTADLNGDKVVDKKDLAWYVCNYQATENLPDLKYQFDATNDGEANGYEICLLNNRLHNLIYDEMDDFGGKLDPPFPKIDRSTLEDCTKS